MSVQFFCPFFECIVSLVVCLGAIQHHKLFVNFGDYALISHIICKYFLPICGLSFSFIYCFLCCAKAFEFKVPFVYFCFYFYSSGRWIKKDVSVIYVRECLPILSSPGFIVSGLTSRSLIHFELISVYGFKEWSIFFFFTCGCPVFPAPFVEEIIFPTLCSLVFFVID